MTDPTQWDTRPARPAAISAPAVALASIWAAVAAISLFAPDLVSGSEQQHLPVAAFGTWMWGAVATFSVLVALSRLRGDGPTGLRLAGAVCAVWTVAAVVSIAAPSMVTGSDPTRLPIASLVAPVAAAVLTVGVCGFAATVTTAGRRG
jgi:hypothetical protein